ncbi:terminase small subunit [Sphingobacterium daejeonense]|uniref:Terminase small subunit n=1 Tax=Sphingobacterium daejeonense TaxID=371142 RepID=A0ABW3RKD0_9SPHI
MALTDKQQRFVEEYMVDLNATQAAIRAGYSQNTAHSIGAENLIKPEIQEAIQKRKQELSDQTGITAERVLKEYAKIAFSDIRELVRGKVFDITGSEWEGGVTKIFAKTVPYRHPSVMGGVTIKKDLFLNGVEYGLNFRKNFTVNFWYKMKVNHAPGTSEPPKFLFGTKLDSGFNMSRRYRTVFRLANTNVLTSVPNSFRTVFWTEYQMVTIVVTNETLPTVKFYTNGRLSGSVVATSFNNATCYIDWKIGGGNNQGSGGYINDDGKMTDFKLWNRILTDDEIIRMYEGNKIVTVK